MTLQCHKRNQICTQTDSLHVIDRFFDAAVLEEIAIDTELRHRVANHAHNVERRLGRVQRRDLTTLGRAAWSRDNGAGFENEGRNKK